MTTETLSSAAVLLAEQLAAVEADLAFWTEWTSTRTMTVDALGSGLAAKAAALSAALAAVTSMSVDQFAVEAVQFAVAA